MQQLLKKFQPSFTKPSALSGLTQSSAREGRGPSDVFLIKTQKTELGSVVLVLLGMKRKLNSAGKGS